MVAFVDTFTENEVFETHSKNHLLVFKIPSSDENEKFIRAELKILTLLDINSIDSGGKFFFDSETSNINRLNCR